MNCEPFDPLSAFFHWFMGAWRGGCFPSVHDGIAWVGNYTGMVLYRQPPFQVELWIIPPNTESPPHGHPGTDIFLVHVTGEIKVWVGDELVLGPVQTVPDDRTGITKSNGRFVRLPPGQIHRAGTGPMGGAFMNVQLWLDGKPRFTSEDWAGDALNEEHKKKLEKAKIAAFVKSLPENSHSCTKEPESTSKKEARLVVPAGALREDSTQRPLILRGVGSSQADGENCGQVSLQEPAK